MKLSDSLADAIRTHSKISFRYRKNEILRGVRVGDPYVLYEHRTKEGKSCLKLDVVQTSWFTDSPGNPFPSFREFDVDKIEEVVVLQEKFEPNHSAYNPDNERYMHAIAKA